MKQRFPSMDTEFIFIKASNDFRSGFGVDAKHIGNILDEILDYMDEHNISILPELMELKQYLRFKGNSKREHGDLRYWRNE